MDDPVLNLLAGLNVYGTVVGVLRSLGVNMALHSSGVSTGASTGVSTGNGSELSSTVAEGAKEVMAEQVFALGRSCGGCGRCHGTCHPAHKSDRVGCIGCP